MGREAVGNARLREALSENEQLRRATAASIAETPWPDRPGLVALSARAHEAYQAYERAQLDFVEALLKGPRGNAYGPTTTSSLLAERLKLVEDYTERVSHAHLKASLHVPRGAEGEEKNVQ